MKVRRLRWRFYRKAGGARHIGRRCKDYYPGCIVCDSYRFLDERGRFPYNFGEAYAFAESMLEQDPAHREQVRRWNLARARGV